MAVRNHGTPEIWRAYGLAGDPFFQEELHPLPSLTYPVSLFVGRGDELRLANRLLGNAPSTRALVEGAPGVGKTTFVNRLKSDFTERDFLTHTHPVRITAHTTLTTFVADVMRELLRLRTAHGLGLTDFWKRTSRILEGEDLISGGIGFGGASIALQSTRIPAEMPNPTLYSALAEALDRLTDEMSSPMLIHVNNLENLGEDNAQQAAVLLRDLRDYLLIPGAHWVFVAADGSESSVFRRFDQVGGIFPSAVLLDALAPETVARMLHKRYEYLHDPALGDLVPPVRPEVAADLYRLYSGDLRNFLRLLSDAAAMSLGIDGVAPLSRDRIIAATAHRYARRLTENIGAADFEHLENIVATTDETREFYVGGAANALPGLSQSATSRLIDRLRNKGVVTKTRARGRRTYYRPTGEACIALGLPATDGPR